MIAEGQRMRAAEPSAPASGPPCEEERSEATWVGRVLAGRYRIDARLGEGGMGAVYRARHLALDRDVAVKVLHPRLTEDPVVARRFDREALAASRLDHPGCVQMLDAGTAEDGTKFLVMQLLSGSPLRSAGDGPMARERAVDLTLQILCALEHAHRRGLVHRDLKPENVIITRDDDDREVVKLLDFGIVKLLSGVGDDETLTRAGMVFGTPRYMSPEQAAGGKVDARADLYTVGVLLYEMLAGAPPFQGDDMGIVLRMHILADPPPLPEHVPAPIAAVVMRLLGKRAAERFASAKETHDALQAAAREIAPAPPPIARTAHTVLAMPAPPAVGRRPRENRHMLVAIAALVVLALGIAIGWALLSSHEGTRRPIEVSRPPSSHADPAAAASSAPASLDSEEPAEARDLGDDAEAPATRSRRAKDRPSKHAEHEREARKRREEKEREARKRREEKEREARKRREEKGRKHRDGKAKDH